MSQNIQFTNAKDTSILIDETEDYMLQNLQITSVPVLNQNEKSYQQDGTTFLGTLLEMRDISFNVVVFGNSIKEIYQKRRNLINVFNPKLGEGTLIYTNDFTSKSITCVSDFVPNFASGQENQTGYYQIGVISMTANNPFFTDNDDTTIKLEDFVGNFEFPFTFPVQFALRGDSAIIDNIGDVETPIFIEFRGPATNPQLTNETTEEFIKVNRTLLVDEKLLINTEFGNKSVIFEDSTGNQFNAYNDIDIDSTFFDLEIGENTISFITDAGSPEVFVTYRNRFVGV